MAWWSALTPGLIVFVVLAPPLRLLMMCAALRLIGVPKTKVCAWAMRQAERESLVDLIRTWAGRRT